MDNTTSHRQLTRRAFAALAVSAPAAAATMAAAPANAGNAPTVTFETDSAGELLTTVNRQDKAIAAIDCLLTYFGSSSSCSTDLVLRGKRSTTYRIHLEVPRAVSAVGVGVQPTVLVKVTFTDGGTASGSILLDQDCTPLSACVPTASTGTVFAGGVDM